MSLGKVIRKYRKIRNMTQEEMAGRLGVTAPAVNKWENENSFPDITLLAPIARLLGISLDTLLSFREELTADEINGILQETEQKLKEEPYEEVFQWAKKKLEQYPNCDELILNLAILLDAGRIFREVPNEADYDAYLCSLYIRVLDSTEERIRVKAADALVGFYMRKDQYDQAEKYLAYFSIQNPERKRKQAQIYASTGKTQEAYKAYEELLYADFQRVSMELHGIYSLALQEKNMEKARSLVVKQEEAARFFEMGRYYEVSNKLEIAALEKDADTVLAVMKEMLASLDQIGNVRKASLYEHLDFKETSDEFLTELRENLLKCFRDEESFGFLKNDKRWQELIEQQ